jgi:hypothetical protein
MDERLRQTVRERAGYRCEYCCLPQDAEPFFAYHVEHIVARQHGGRDDSGNLALACYLWRTENVIGSNHIRRFETELSENKGPISDSTFGEFVFEETGIDIHSSCPFD